MATNRFGRHVPVMPDEVVEMLAPRAGGRYVDGTLGEGGHAGLVLEASAPDGELLGIDWDGDALDLSRNNLAGFGSRLVTIRSGYGPLRSILAEQGWEDGVDGILIDLGISTYQLGVAERGFAFSEDGPLDMRMDSRLERSAADLVADLPEEDLADVIYRYGEERASRRIARFIVRRRADSAVVTTADLREIVRRAIGGPHTRRDPATKTFQALRIAVNGELEQLEAVLDGGWQLLRPGGTIVFLTYHSLEDRMVKQAFRAWAAKCICPDDLPICVCDWTAKVELLTRRKLRPSQTEIDENPRARSAGLRSVRRLGPDVGAGA